MPNFPRKIVAFLLVLCLVLDPFKAAFSMDALRPSIFPTVRFAEQAVTPFLYLFRADRLNGSVGRSRSRVVEAYRHDSFRTVSRRGFLKSVAAVAAVIETSVSALALQASDQAREQDLMAGWKNPAKRPVIDDEWVGRASRDARFRADLFRWIASEHLVALAQQDQETLDALRQLTERLFQIKESMTTLLDLFKTDANPTVRSQVLEWLNLSVFDADRIIPPDFDSVLVSATAQPELIDQALALLLKIMPNDPTRHLTILSELIQSSDLANARGDIGSADRIDSLIAGLPKSENIPLMDLANQDTPILNSLLRLLANREPFVDEEHDAAYDHILEAAHWPHWRAAAFRLLNSTPLDTARVRDYLGLWIELKRIGHENRDAALEHDADIRLNAVMATPEHAMAFLWMTHNSNDPDYGAIPFSYAGAMADFLKDVPKDEWMNYTGDLEDALIPPETSEAAGKIIEALRSQLDSSEQTLMADAKAAAPLKLRQRKLFLSNLRQIVIDSEASLAPDPDNPADNTNISTREEMKKAMTYSDTSDLRELLRAEKDPDVARKLILSLAHFKSFYNFYDDWTALKRVIDVLDNPGSLGPFTVGQSGELRRSAAYILAQKPYINPFSIQTTRVALKLKGTLGTINPPEFGALDHPESGDLLDGILDNLAERDVIEAYMESRDSTVRLQAMKRLLTAKDTPSALEARPDVLVELIHDLRSPAHQPLALSLLSLVNHPVFMRSVMEMLVIQYPEFYRQDAATLIQILGIAEDPRAVQTILSQLALLPGSHALGPHAAQQLLRLLPDPFTRNLAGESLLQFTLSAADRRTALEVVLDALHSTPVSTDPQGHAFYSDLFNRLTNRADYAESLILLWRDSVNHRHRVAALHRMMTINPAFLQKFPGLKEALRRAAQDPEMGADATTLLPKLDGVDQSKLRTAPLPLLFWKNIVLGTLASIVVGSAVIIASGLATASNPLGSGALWEVAWHARNVPTFLVMLGFAVPLTVLLHELSHAFTIRWLTGQWPELVMRDSKNRLMFGLLPKTIGPIKAAALAGPLSGLVGITLAVALSSFRTPPYAGIADWAYNVFVVAPDVVPALIFPSILINALALVWGDGESWKETPIRLHLAYQDFMDMADTAELLSMTMGPDATLHQRTKTLVARWTEGKSFDDVFLLRNIVAMTTQRIPEDADPEIFMKASYINEEVAHLVDLRRQREDISQEHIDRLLLATQAFLSAMNMTVDLELDSDQELTASLPSTFAAGYDPLRDKIFIELPSQFSAPDAVHTGQPSRTWIPRSRRRGERIDHTLYESLDEKLSRNDRLRIWVFGTLVVGALVMLIGILAEVLMDRILHTLHSLSNSPPLHTSAALSRLAAFAAPLFTPIARRQRSQKASPLHDFAASA